MVKLTPVDHDPFAPPASQPAGIKLTPVEDYDPFISEKIDFNRPVEAVRADIGKLNGKTRQTALDAWAKHYVANEKRSGADTTVRTLSRGSFVGPWLDELNAATNAGLHTVTGGYAGAPYDESLAYQRARDKHTDDNHPIASTAGQIVGGVASGVAALPIQGVNAAAQVGSRGAQALRAGQYAIGGPAAAVNFSKMSLPKQMIAGGAIGAAYGAHAGFGNAEGKGETIGEQINSRAEGMSVPAIIGGGIGTLLPPAIVGAGKGLGFLHEQLSPTAARVGAWWANGPGKPRMPAGVMQMTEGGMPPARPPVNSPADDLGAVRHGADDLPQSGASAPPPAAPSRPAAAGGGGGRGNPPRTIGSAGDQPLTPLTPGAEAAAEQVIANQLQRAGVPVSRLRAQLAEADEAANFYTNSNAKQVLAPVDLDQSLARLAGSAGRHVPEAANIGKSFHGARQSGLPQTQLPPTSGLPTRPANSRPVPGEPVGQQERILDALRRAFTIKRKEFHGHSDNAYQTRQQIIDNARANADADYGATYKAAEGIDLSKRINKIVSQMVDPNYLIDQSTSAVSQIQAAAKQIARAVEKGGSKSHFERLQRVKESLDRMIDDNMPVKDLAGQVTRAGDKDVVREITRWKNTLLDSMDKVKGPGKLYQKARARFSSDMEARDILDLGAKLARENSDVVIDQVAKQLGNPDHAKLLRLGFLGEIQQQLARTPANTDITARFMTPRMQQILSHMIPRTQTAVRGDPKGVYGNRPERFGQFIQNERAMTDSNRIAQGGSPTMRNAADDQAFGHLNNMIEGQRSGGVGPTELAIKVMAKAFHAVFGFKADTAAAVARKLYTADPAERARLLEAIEARMGPSRAHQLAEFLSRSQGNMSGAAGTSSGMADPNR